MTRRNKHQQQPPMREPAPPADWKWWVLAAAIPLVHCASRLNLDLWYDEAYTLDVFVSQPWPDIARDYSAPNNHVLYSLLLRPVYMVSDSEFLLRLPSFAFTVGTLWLVFRLTRRWAGLPAGLLATLWLGLTQMFLIHTMEVRGYGLSMFLAAWLGDLALGELRVESRESRAKTSGLWTLDSRLSTLPLVGAAFLYVMPSNLLFFLPLAAVAVVRAAGLARGTAPFSLRENRDSPQLVSSRVLGESLGWGGALGLAGLVYLPILGQVLDAGRGGMPASLSALGSLTYGVYSAAMRDWLLVLPLAAMGLAWWTRETLRQPSREHVALPVLAVAMLVGPFCLAGVLGIVPFVRNYCPVLPFLAVAMGWLVAELLGAAGRLVPVVRSDPAKALVGMALLACVAGPRLRTYPARLAEHRRTQFAQDGYFNYYAADFHPSEVVAYLQRSTGPNEPYRICYADADHFPLWHYFRRARLALERIGGIATPEPATVVYLIAPAVADYEALSAKSGLPAEVLRALPPLEDFGYYRLYQYQAQ